MKAFFEGISSRISRGREAIDRRRRFNSTQPTPFAYDEEPTITITPAPIQYDATINNYEVNASDDGENRRQHQEAERDVDMMYCLARSDAWLARHGLTVLHWSVSCLPLPIDVFNALIARDPDMVNVLDRSGNLPLHIACSHHAPAEVIHALIQTNPKTCSVRDGSGFCALHILCDLGCSTESLRAALRVLLQSTEGATILAKKDYVFGRTPLNILNQRKNLTMFTSCVESLRALRQRERDAILCGNWKESDRMKLATRMNEAKEMEFWCKARLLILAEYALCRRNGAIRNSLDDFNDHDIIQACLGVKECPLSLLEYVLLVYDKELFMKDRNGDLPLHQACANSKELTDKQRIIAEVLLANPKAARVTNGSGRLPL